MNLSLFLQPNSASNVYSVNPEKKKLHGKFIKSKSANNSRSSSVVTPPNPSYLYEISSKNCPCDHHRLARLREESSDASSLISSPGDSGVNSNSNGSNRSSGRIFTLSTIEVHQHHQIEHVDATSKKNKPIQISPENDPSHNWTLVRSADLIDEDSEDSLFSSLKTSHSNSLKALCTCHLNASEEQPIDKPRPLRRVSSFPKCHPAIDPHRFDLKLPCTDDLLLRQLPTVPPETFTYWEVEPRIARKPHPLFPPPFPPAPPAHDPLHGEAIPPCVRNVIIQQMQQPPKPCEKRAKRAIHLPEDPSDPTAFTVSHDQYLLCKNNHNMRSRKVAKIVGTFSFLSTIGIVITVLCFLYWSDTFKPMTMT